MNCSFWPDFMLFGAAKANAPLWSPLTAQRRCAWIVKANQLLTIRKIKALEPRSKRYTVSDGRGLGVEVQPSGLKSWRLRYRLRGRPGKINLGRFPVLSLA